MGITVAWGNADQTYLLIVFEKPWNWDDFQGAVDRMNILFKDITHKADLLIDIRNAGFPPEGAVRRFKSVGEQQQPNVDQVIYIAPRVLAHFIQSINQVISAVFFNYKAPNFVFVSTLEEAYILVAQKHEERSSA